MFWAACATLVTFMESTVPRRTQSRVGEAPPEVRDFRKVAATFCDLEAGPRRVRVVALEGSNRGPRKCFLRLRIGTRSRSAYPRVTRIELLRGRLGARDARPGRIWGTRRRAWFAPRWRGRRLEREVVRGRHLCARRARASAITKRFDAALLHHRPAVWVAQCRCSKTRCARWLRVSNAYRLHEA